MIASQSQWGIMGISVYTHPQGLGFWAKDKLGVLTFSRLEIIWANRHLAAITFDYYHKTSKFNQKKKKYC